MSREIPYSPMGEKKRISFERMQEILAKHRKPSGPAKEAAPAVVEAKRMKWRKREGYENVVESDGGYTVTHCPQSGRFIAFCGRTTPAGSPVVLGGWDGWEEARIACEAHRSLNAQAA